MKTTNKLSKWCKSTLMLPAVAVVLTFTSCQKDDLLFEGAPGVQAGTEVSSQSAALGAKAMTAGTYVITFEGIDPSYLAGPTSYGDNLYAEYGDDRYFGYYDDATGLYMMINPTGKYSPDPTFYNGGIAISQWNDTLTPNYKNQCSVYYKDPNTGYGGYGGSKTFALHFGYNDPTYMGDTRTYVSFEDTTKTCVFEGFYVTNNTYAARAMKYGEGSRPFGKGDWFKLIIDGIAPDGSVTGTVEFYLADFREDYSPGVVEDWEYVDLSPLGEVTAIRFDLQSSDTGSAGMNTPAYFCFDDLTVVLDQ
jgi:hypothetical protein